MGPPSAAASPPSTWMGYSCYNYHHRRLQQEIWLLVRHLVIALALALLVLGGHTPSVGRTHGRRGTGLAVAERPPGSPSYFPVPRTTLGVPRIVQHVGALFELPDFSIYQTALQASINRTNTAGGPGRWAHLAGVALPALNNTHQSIIYICDAVLNNNISAFIAIGSQDTINILSIVTSYVGIPIVGYSTSKKTTSLRVSWNSSFKRWQDFYTQDIPPPDFCPPDFCPWTLILPPPPDICPRGLLPQGPLPPRTFAP